MTSRPSTSSVGPIHFYEDEKDKDKERIERVCESDEFVPISRVHSTTFDSFPESPFLHLNSASFDFLSLLGSGSFGRVFRVRIRSSCEEFALKVINRDGRDSYRDLHEALEEEEEYRIMKIVGRFPYIVTMREYWNYKDNFPVRSVSPPSRTMDVINADAAALSESASKDREKKNKKMSYILLDLVRGGRLQDIFDRRHFNSRRGKRRPIPLELAKFWLAEIVLALEFIHSKHIVFRDLKPDNVLLDSEGHIVLCDFGVCGLLGPQKAKLCRKIGGSGFKPPEMHKMHAEVKKRWEKEKKDNKKLVKEQKAKGGGKEKVPSDDMVPPYAISPPSSPSGGRRSVTDDIEVRSRRASDIMIEATQSGVGYDYSVDWWNFGIVARSMLTMKHPFYRRYSLFGADRRVKDDDYHIKKTTQIGDVENDFCLQLLEKDVQKRMGCRRADAPKGSPEWVVGSYGASEVMKHPFFDGIDWDRMRRRDIAPPLVDPLPLTHVLTPWPADKKPEYEGLEGAMKAVDDDDPNHLLIAALDHP